MTDRARASRGAEGSPVTAMDEFYRAGSLGEMVAAAASQLKSAGVDRPGVEARRLIAEVLGFSPEQMIAEPDLPIDEGQAGQLRRALRLRYEGVPVSRICGQAWFYGRRFEIGPETLDPRADSECVVETVLTHCSRLEISDRPLRILDIGTGSGCLAITLLKELPNSVGFATDIQPGAVALARKNAEAHGISSRLRVFECDGVTALAKSEDRFDIIVSNPPYIESGAIGSLEGAVTDHDPAMALDGGPDGLSFYRAWLADAARLRSAKTSLTVFEIGYRQGSAVTSLARHHLTGHIRLIKDLAGRDRCVAISSET